MFGHKKVSEPPTEPVEQKAPEPLPDHTIELRAYWEDETAEWSYGLYKLGTRGSFWDYEPQPGNWEWHRVAASGSKEWANRQAEHYSVSIIYEEVK